MTRRLPIGTLSTAITRTGSTPQSIARSGEKAGARLRPVTLADFGPAPKNPQPQPQRKRRRPRK